MSLWPAVLGLHMELPSIPVSTTFDLPGYRVVKHIGPVFGITVRTRAIGPKIIAGFRGLVGGEVASFTILAEQVRHESMERMVAEAMAHGANAVLGMRFDGSEIMPGNTEVFCYGTAVVVEKA